MVSLRRSLSISTYRKVTRAALIALAFIIVTGGAVRITGSGLGCPDWPNCSEDRFIAPLEYHALIEFVNRMVTGLVSLTVILAVLGALLIRPRRRDLVWLSLGLVGGVLGQIILGALTVLFHLAPPLVMGHFLLSMVILANAVVLHRRTSSADGADLPEKVAKPNRSVQQLSSLLVVNAAIVIFLGTIVTASGPHGGDEDVERLPFAVPDVARIHGTSVMIFVLMILTVLWMISRDPNAAALRKPGYVLLLVVLSQATIGYVQYFTGVPVLLVGIHIAGAVAVWLATLNFCIDCYRSTGPYGTSPHRLAA